MQNNPNQKKVAEEYEEMWNKAMQLGSHDIDKYPLDKKEARRDRVSWHLIGMMEMYSIRYGDIELKKRVLNYLENSLFPKEKPVCSLTIEQWWWLRQVIMTNEYMEEDNADTNL
jgi:hypothetical protein